MKQIRLFSYFGGKSFMLDDIYGEIGNIYAKGKLKCLVDVFGGSGVVVLSCPPEWKCSRIYNDINYNIYKTFEQVRNKESRDKIFDALMYAVPHEEYFQEARQRLKNPDENYVDDWKIAYDFLYTFGCSYAGAGMSFARSMSDHERGDIGKLLKQIKSNYPFLQKVIFDNMNFEDLIELYDSPTTLFYLDPPYYSGGASYKYKFKDDEFKRLKHMVDNIQGYWLMNESEVDFPYINKLFGEPYMVKQYKNSVRHQSQGNTKKNRIEGYYGNIHNTV